MSFNVRLCFSGIVGFVPNKPYGESPSRIAALFPDGRNERRLVRKAADKVSDLRRHKGFFLVRAKHFSGAQAAPSDSLAILYLDRFAYSFEVGGGTGMLRIGEIDFLAQIPEVAAYYPRFSVVDPACFGSTPPDELLCRCILKEGEFTTKAPDSLFGEKLPDTIEWKFPNTLSASRAWAQQISPVISVNHKGVSAFNIVRSKFDGTPVDSYQFWGQEGEWVEILFVNFCDENPLRWKTAKSSLPPDEDFRWYFELLTKEDKEALFLTLLGLPLPIPYQRGVPLGNGMNCLPAGYGVSAVLGEEGV